MSHSVNQFFHRQHVLVSPSLLHETINSNMIGSVSPFVYYSFLIPITLASVKEMNEFLEKNIKWQDTMMANLKKYREPVTVEKFPQQNLRIIPLSVQCRLEEGADHR